MLANTEMNNNVFSDTNNIYNRSMRCVPIIEHHPRLFKFEIIDIKQNNISDLFLSIKIPKLRGNGSVAFVKNAPYLLINKLEVLYENLDGSKYLIQTLDGEDIFKNINIRNQKYMKYLKQFNIDFCTERRGTFEDDIIFDELTLNFPIMTNLEMISLYPNKKLVISFQFNSISTILTYDKTFADISLKTYKNDWNDSANNIFLFYMQKPRINKIANEYFQINRTKGEYKVETMKTNITDKSIQINFNVKSINFENIHTYVINPRTLNKEDILKRFSEKLAYEVIKISDEKPNQYYEEIKTNKKEFKTISKSCHINIIGIPDTLNIYYHNKIMSYGRKGNLNETINFSNKFRTIEGIWNGDYIHFTKIEHEFTIVDASIPVEFWNHYTNNLSGDLRSQESKQTDFYYKNRFINNIDFLSSRQLIKNIKMRSDDGILEVPPLGSVISLNEHNNEYPSTYTYPFTQVNFPINKNIQKGFDRFDIDIVWDHISDNDILHIFRYNPIIDIYEIHNCKNI